jgi:hypothetical protein
MKLIVRICVSPVVSLGRCAPFRWHLDTHALFPDICSETENGFVGDENCFIGTSQRNNSGRKFNVFNVALFWTAPQISKNRDAPGPSGFLNFSVGTGLARRQTVNRTAAAADLPACMQLF